MFIEERLNYVACVNLSVDEYLPWYALFSYSQGAPLV
jgi:hypothetical protein